MKRTLTGLGIVLLFSFMLLSPKAVFSGASSGLLLWFQTILPTLFPFLLVSNLLLATGSIHYLTSAFSKICRTFLSVSDCGSFAVITGFLCGYPMGAKTAADLNTQGYITHREACYLLSFCNNTSPVFIMNYIVYQTLEDETLLLPTLFILLVSPLFVSLITRCIYKMSLIDRVGNQNTFARSAAFSTPAEERSKEPGFSFRQLDHCIMDSCETLVKVGGYIILFSVLSSIVSSSPFPLPGSKFFLPFLEVTNGISMIGSASMSMRFKYPMLLGLTSFGGFCAVMQTQSMVQKAGLPIFPYFTEKLAAALTASSLGYLYMIFR